MWQLAFMQKPCTVVLSYSPYMQRNSRHPSDPIQSRMIFLGQNRLGIFKAVVSREVVSRQCQVKLEESLLTPIKILSLEYESEAESSVGSVLLVQEQSLPTLPPLTPISSSSSSLLPYTMSQPNYSTIIRQLQEQVEVLTTQLAERTGGVGGGAAVNIKVAKLQVFDRILSKVLGFVIACKLYLRIKMNKTALEEQI